MKRKPSKRKALKPEPFRLFWIVGTGKSQTSWECPALPLICPKCDKTETLFALPPPVLKKQPDDTNVVCHPAAGGCNHGFHFVLAPKAKKAGKK